MQANGAPIKWPYKWITRVKTPTSGIITLLYPAYKLVFGPTSWELIFPTDPSPKNPQCVDPRLLLKHNLPQAAAELEGRAMNEEEQRLQKALGKSEDM